MKKRIWIYTLIGLFVIAAAILALLLSHPFFVQPVEADLQYYLDLPPENDYYAGEPCIPDAQTAVRVGGAIIDNMCNKGAFHIGVTTVEYDRVNRLWKVDKNYLFSQGGSVIIQQDTGEILRALLNK